MLPWARRTLASLALCALLSLTLATAATLACPGEGGGEIRETLTVSPREHTFTFNGDTERFTFTYRGSREGFASDTLFPGEHFRKTEDECEGRRMRNGDSCVIGVRMIREFGAERLRVRLLGLEAAAALIG